MARRRIWKRLLIVLGILFLVLLAVVLTFPYWMPKVVEQAAGRFGVEMGEYERLDDGRFALNDITRTNELFDLRIDRIEGFRPLHWYRQARHPDTNDPPTFLLIDGWKVVIHEDAVREDKPGKEERGVYDYYQLARKYIQQARQWMPKALLLNGIVEFQGRPYSFSTITWEEGRLEANGTWPENAIPIDLKARLLPDEPYQLSFAMHPLDFRTRLRLSESNNMVHAEAAAVYQESRADITAAFGQEGLVPEEASLRSEDFKLPAELLKLEGYQEITGDLQGQWAANQYSLNLEAHAEPLHSATNFPPVELALELEGDTNRVRLEALRSTAPGLEVLLSSPVEVNYQGELLSGSSELAIAAELEKLPWLQLRGRIEGTLILEPGGKFPLVQLRAQGRNLGFREFEASGLEFQARVNWPELEQAEGRVDFGANGSVNFAAAANLETRVIESATLRAEGAIATNALPSGMRYDSLNLHASASGPITNLQHAAQLELRGFETEQTTLLNLDLHWQARQAAFEEVALRARAGPAALFLRGSGSVTESSTNLLVRELNLSKGDELHLSLAEPFETSLQSTNLGERGYIPLFVVTPLIWRGQERELDFGGRLAWPWTGQISLAATNFNPDLFQFFVKRSLSGLDIPRLALQARWSQGPLYASITGGASVTHDLFYRLTAQMQLELDDSGLSISQLNVAGTNGPIVTAQGFLPVSVHPLDTGKPVRLAASEAIDFRLQTAPNQPFWEKVGEFAQVQLEEPFVALNISGTTRKPGGSLEFRVESVALTATNRELPRVGPVEGSVLLNEARLRIPALRLEVEGEPLMLSTETALGEDFWELRREAMQAYLLTNSAARIVSRRLDLAPFVRFFPEYLAPVGTVQIDAGVQPGLTLAGEISATNIATRPLPKIGVVENIHARIHLEEQQVRITELAAMIGGETLRISGAVNLAPEQLRQGSPGINIRIEGENVPLARNPDVILRSDLNLLVSNSETNPPRISGDVNLRESVLLQDISTLVPGRVASPSRRPPYFSIDQELIDDWTLDIRVRGVEFMRVRSPFFQGRISAAFRVSGTLEEPMALGEARVPSGRVIFPFANLAVTQGLVSLTSGDPYVPHVFVIAKGRSFGYDISMQVEGPAHEPVIEFSSVPSLTSEEIVLLLTTGQMPRSDFGYTSEQRAGRLAFFLGKSLLSKLNPGASDEERLIIRSGEDVSEQGKQTYGVEYKLSDQWSLVGEYDRFGAVNAGMKWKIFSK